MTTPTMSADERYVRCCPTHGVAVEEHGTQLICPKGGRHAVAKFKVVDRLKRTEELVPVDGDQTRGGVEMVEKSAPSPIRPAPGASAAPAPPAAAKKTPPAQVLHRAKFKDEAENVLWVRLVKETKKLDGVIYVVRWTLQEPGGFHPKTRLLAVEAYQEPARKVYDDQVAVAKKAGWTEVLTSGRGREFTFVPLPSPAKKKRS